MFCEVLVDGLLRSDIKTRYEAYNTGRLAGFLCVNDIREKENLNPLPDDKGKIFLQPLNYMEVGGEPPKNSPGEGWREAYRQWFIVQWTRIIKKQIGLVKSNNGFDYGQHREYAKMLLMEPASTLASYNNLPDTEANKRLQSFINLNINEKRKVELSDAEKMADLLMDRIGGNHAVT